MGATNRPRGGYTEYIRMEGARYYYSLDQLTLF